MFNQTMVPVVSASLLTSLLTSIALSVSAAAKSDSLELSSSAFADGGTLPVQYSCEGEGMMPPLNWTGVPMGTQSLVLIMDHQPAPRPVAQQGDMPPPPSGSHEAQPVHSEGANPKAPKPADELRWYWTVYNIPADASAISNEQTAGTFGSNVVNDINAYAPPCSKGPGLKSYTFHLYALSTALEMSEASIVSEATLRASMSDSILDADTLTVNFERRCRLAPNQDAPKPPSSKNRPPKTHTPQGSEQDARRDPPPVLPLCAPIE